MARKTTAHKPTANKIDKSVTAETTSELPEIADTADGPKVMGKRELVNRVVEASGIKKRAAKPVVEAMLKELGDALSRGETLNLQPFGKGIVKNYRNLENAEVVELRLRRSKQAIRAAEESDEDPLAQPAE
ncbi:HU family DNA-binding protein [Pseudoruegeria sp. HB172150]|uniref:HU family DNA-binding protein n=1 Tax=Pseudoruegeria sp. HB172150 TaxID=2721164 RepID=UPI0015518E1B|nr:HU family DNA-binding protein [Pseudoruegeria sp. HB172150]